MAADVYKLQNVTIHTARQQLEAAGVLNPWSGLDQIREMAAEINSGIASISKLSLEQRRELIDRLIEKGAQVKNPFIYDSDLRTEAAKAGVKRKVLNFRGVSEKELRLMDALAAQVHWKDLGGYARLCDKVIKGPRPKNRKELTAVCAALRSMIKRQEARSAEVPDEGHG